jgi:hypothetical protein
LDCFLALPDVCHGLQDWTPEARYALILVPSYSAFSLAKWIQCMPVRLTTEMMILFIIIRLYPKILLCCVPVSQGDPVHPADPTWLPLLPTPPSPDYPDVYLAVSAAATTVLTQ